MDTDITHATQDALDALAARVTAVESAVGIEATQTPAPGGEDESDSPSSKPASSSSSSSSSSRSK